MGVYLKINSIQAMHHKAPDICKEVGYAKGRRSIHTLINAAKSISTNALTIIGPVANLRPVCPSDTRAIMPSVNPPIPPAANAW